MLQPEKSALYMISALNWNEDSGFIRSDYQTVKSPYNTDT